MNAETELELQFLMGASMMCEMSYADLDTEEEFDCRNEAEFLLIGLCSNMHESQCAVCPECRQEAASGDPGYCGDCWYELGVQSAMTLVEVREL